MLTPILFVLAVASLAQGKSLEPREATCNEQTFKVCMGAFAVMTDSIQMSSGDLVKHYSDKIKSGIEGFNTVCMGTQMLRMCADHEAGGFDSCVSVSAWKARGLDTINAKNYAAFFPTLDYICSAPVKQVYEQNYDCWTSTEKNEEAVLTQCSKDFAESGSQDCGALQTLLDCYSAPFRQQCDEAMGSGVCQVTGYIFNELQGRSVCTDLKC